MTIADISQRTSQTIVDRLQNSGLRTCRKIADLSDGENMLGEELQEKYQAAVADITSVVIKPLGSTEGAFVVIAGVLYLDEEPIAKILDVVLREFEERVAANDSGLNPDNLPELLEKVFIGYMLHELRHRTQGLEFYKQVQQLKSIGGRGAVSGLDVLADRDGAFAYAAVQNNNSRAEFLASFREALFFSSAYFFKVFPIADDRHGKIERAIAVLLMAARLAPLHLVDPVDERPDLRLDAPLTVMLSANNTSLAIFKGEPSRRLIGSANQANDVRELVAEVSSGNFDGALERSVRLVATLRDFR